MDTRRKAKLNTDVYKQLNEDIKNECHAAKASMLTAQCDLIEQLESAHKIEQLESAHKFHLRRAQICKVTGRGNKAGVTTGTEDRDRNIIMEQENILERWHEYISTFYDDTRGGIPLISYDTKLSPITRT